MEITIQYVMFTFIEIRCKLGMKITTHFSLAWASDGTVAPFPFAYISIYIGLIALASNKMCY